MPIRKPILIIAIGAVLLFFGVVFCPSGQAGSYWRKVNVNHPGQINGVAMSPSGRHIVINGDFGLHSSDRGVTWDTTSGFVPFIMDYGDEKHAFGVGSGQNGSVGVYHSSDSGKTWLRIGLPDNLIIFGEVNFVDSAHGWAAGNKDFIVTTIDGWQTWTTESYGVSGFKGGAISFLDTLQGFVAGWLAGTDSTVVRTTDGGNSWSVLPTGIFSLAGISVDFVDSLNGWLVGLTGERRLYHTTDGGGNWVEQVPFGGFGFIEKVDMVDSLNAWVLANTSNPRIWRTSDGGQSWALEYDESGGSLLDFVMVDSVHGVAAGSSGHVVILAPIVLGDLNGDEEIDLKDIALEANWVFLGLPFDPPQEAGDVNCNGDFTASDVVLVINRAFLDAPFPCNL